MKTLRSLASIAIAISLATLMNCHHKHHDPTPEPTQADKVTALLVAGQWKLSQLQIDDTVDDGFFNGLTITFTNTGFTAVNGDPVWPANGTWSFTDANAQAIKRNDNIEVAIETIDADNLQLSLQWNQTTIGGRLASVSGKYTFKFGH
jgi:hypothetical protein